MATIAENLQTILDIKNDIKSAIIAKGVSVADSDGFATYPSKIESIESGGGGTLETINITENGVYVPSEGVDGYNQVNVNVVPSTNYTYYDGGVDVDGLRAIGWSDESIGMLRDNAPHYSWQNDEFVVSEENKRLYGVINSNNSNNYRNNSDMVFLPYFEPNSGINLNNYKYVKAIPSVEKQVTFIDCYYAESLIIFPIIDTSKTRIISFNGCKSLTTIPLLNTINVTDMSRMFTDCLLLTTIPQLNTSNVTNMQYMFYECDSLTTIPQLDTSKVTNMQYMFTGCSSLTTIPTIDTGIVTNMQSMFQSCSSLKHIPLIDTSKVTNMQSMFSGCIKLTTIPELDISNVTNMYGMFQNCTTLQTLPLLECGNVTNISTFFGYSNINTLTDLGGFKNLKVDWTDNYGLYKLPNLTYQSVMNVINNLYDFRSNGDDTTTRTIKFNANSKALLSDEDIAIATNKGWIIS